ncbi:CamS family sex pheromone protein [Enterococcus nangangensis]|uniref:CamS family sex pheromone protein n=1 Tax=Enterococcus nangangensis TaxID=2559926 RepID=UPI0010FA343C|nr:CamS family sex pheromone protein [Enterococcus nangangensis]
MLTRKKILLGGACLALGLLAGCGKLENISTADQTSNSGTITTGRVDEKVYQALLVDGQYQTGIANGVETSTLNSNYNTNNFQTGLLRLAQLNFATDKYYFQEGQKIDGVTLRNWLGRKTDDNPDGLNAGDASKGQAVQKIIEYDFISADSEKLAGLVIGVALNQVDYSVTPNLELSNEEMLAQGRQAANSILTRLRQEGDLKEIPIYIALFQQAKNDDVQGGNFILGSLSDGTATVDKWDTLSENHILLPVTSGDNEATQDGLNAAFKTFQSATTSFFPNLTGVSGMAYYAEGKLVKLTITVESGYYTKAEVTSFTQFVAKTAQETFAKDVTWEISVNAVTGTQSNVISQGDADPIAHVFN